MFIKRTSLVRSTGFLTVYSVLSLLINLVVQAVVANLFGAGTLADAYFVAVVIPGTMAAMFVSSLNLIFIPEFTEKLVKDGEKKAWGMLSRMITLLLLILGFLSLLTLFYSSSVISIIAPGLAPDAQVIAARLLKFMAPITLLSGLTVIGVSILQVYDHYGTGVWVQQVGAVIYLMLVILLPPQFGIDGVAIAFLFNYIISFLLLVWVFRKFIPLLELSINLGDSSQRTLLVGWSVLFVTTLFRRIDPVVQRFLASFLDVSSITYLSYAYLIVSSLDRLLFRNLGAALFPRLAESVAINDFEKVKDILILTIRFSVFLRSLVSPRL